MRSLKLVSSLVISLLVALQLHGLALVHGEQTCDDLPYPDACHSLSTPAALAASGEGTHRPTFREQNFRGALDSAQRARQAASAVDTSKFDPRTRAAWGDCLELLDQTISNLQGCMTCSPNDDSQTWLSAALADVRTCFDGFEDFKLSSSASPLANYNVSKLLCNSLAVNKGSMAPPSPPSVGHRRLLSHVGFPEWVSAADRRLLQSSNPAANADLVVAKDGSGNYRTISEAVSASKTGSKRFVIYVKAGVYKENVDIGSSKKNLMIVGDGIGKTVVTGSRNVQDGSTTFRSATFAVVGSGFIARDMTFENTAGPQKHQAVAMRSGSDLSVFYRCSFRGYQDTLYVHSQRQFYRDCDVYGTVDFIFGDSVAVLQNCNIYLRRPMSNQKNTVTAQGRTDPNENTGISIHNSRVAAAESLGVKSYLGRPWKQYSRTVFMKTNIGGEIDPAGWLEWSGNFALSTLYYGEYQNTGAGAGTSGRVKWPGYRVITSATEAGRFTVGSFLGGGSWLPSTGVPFTAGL